MPKKEPLENSGYVHAFNSIKKEIHQAQIRAVLSVNKELIQLYWAIGKVIAEQQESKGWGSKFIEKLAKDIQKGFPGIEGFSRTNLFRIKAFYVAYKTVPRAVGQLEDMVFCQIPWGHNVLLLEKASSLEERMWYANKTIQHGWSRSMLQMWVKSDLYHREGKALTNFQKTLPAPQSDLAQQSLKDPYIFDFLSLQKDHLEKDLEEGLISHVQKFLLELGQGFAFLGRQYPIEVDGETSYIDLLFYHVKLKCFVIIELKAREFSPKDTGQLNFYLSAVDDLIKQPEDNPTIGIVLCKSKSKVKAEYAFRHINRPIGIAQYEVMLTKSIPKELKSSLPTVKELEKEFEE